MKRTIIENIPFELPCELLRFTEGARIFDSSCSPEARVYFIDKDGGYYLKKSAPGTLEKEAEMTRYFNTLGLGAEVLYYNRVGEQDLLLTSRVLGEDCTHLDYLSEPKRLVDTLAYRLRRLHETDFKCCPVQNHTENYINTVKKNFESGSYDKSQFPDSFGYRTAEEAFAVFKEAESSFKCDTLLHGDYCLPNIMLDNWRFSGFIDVGNGGVGDRHVDLFWGTWTLWFNLKTNKYRERFFDAYGRDKIEPFMIKAVAAAEVFG